MFAIAVKSGHYISADLPRYLLAGSCGKSAFWNPSRLVFSVLAAALLSACAASEERRAPESAFQVPAIASAAIKTDDRRRSVAFETTEDVGTVVVDLAAGFLYLVTGEGRAMRYRIEPLDFKGATNGSARVENWVAGDLQPALGSMIRMKNPEDAGDLHERMPSGGKVVFLSSST